MDKKNDMVLNIRDADVFLENRQILHNINWQIKRGEHWFILGANGAGKTTLCKMIMGHVWPIYGAEVSVMGNIFGQSDLFEVRKKIAWMSPFFHNWADERWRNIDLVISAVDGTIGLFRKPHKHEIEKAMEIMESLECTHIAEKSYEHISAGEQVKVLIARALMTSPELIILDEACVHLDMKSREFLLDHIDKFARKKHAPTIIFITHRIEEIGSVFSNGMILKQGRIINQGKREEILTEENLSKAFDLKVKLQKCGKDRFWAVLEH